MWVSRSCAATVVVNAAGAWADEVARMAGVRPAGLQPYRRTVFTFASHFDSAGWPLVVGADESFYFKPEGADQLLASPADETPEPPCDVKPQEIDVAAGIEAINRATTSTSARSAPPGPACARSLPTGCRSSVSHPGAEGFFWCAGQGGTGIQTSPAMAALTADLISGETPAPPLDRIAPELSPEAIRAIGSAERTSGAHRVMPTAQEPGREASNTVRRHRPRITNGRQRMVRMLWINPVGTHLYDAPIGAELRAEAAPTTRVDVCSLPGVGPQHLEWNALEAVVAGPHHGSGPLGLRAAGL